MYSFSQPCSRKVNSTWNSPTSAAIEKNYTNKGMENLPYEKRLKEVGLVRLAKQWLRGVVVAQNKHISQEKEEWKEEGLFELNDDVDTRLNMCKVATDKFRLTIRNRHLTVRVRCWTSLPLRVTGIRN